MAGFFEDFYNGVARTHELGVSRNVNEYVNNTHLTPSSDGSGDSHEGVRAFDHEGFHVTEFDVLSSEFSSLQVAMLSPRVTNGVKMIASNLSDIATAHEQGAGGKFYVVTANDGSPNSVAKHTLNSYIMHQHLTGANFSNNSIADVILRSSLAKGYLESKGGLGSVYNRSLNPDTTLSLEDRTMMYYSQYTGSLPIYGKTSGDEFAVIRHTPDTGYQDSNVKRRWKGAVTKLKSMFDIPLSDTTLDNKGLGSVNSARYLYQGTLYSNDNISTGYSLSDVRAANTTRPNQGMLDWLSTLHNSMINAPIDRRESASVIAAASAIDPTMIMPSSESSTIQSEAYDNAAQSRIVAEERESLRRQLSETDASSESGSSDSSNNYRHTRISGEGVRPNFGGDAFGASFQRAYTQTNPPTDSSSTDFPIDYIDRISQDDFISLEREFPIGGIEKQPSSSGKLTTTDRSIAALKKLRTMVRQSDFSDDTKFYDRIGEMGLPKNNFEMREVSDPSNIDPTLKKRLQWGGALVDLKDDGTQVWMVDHVGQTSLYVSSQLQDGRSTQFNRNSFILSGDRLAMPNMDMDHRNWELLNTDMSIDEAIGNGYVVPIKDNKAIFVPSFARPDFTYGMEFEVPINHTIDAVLDNVRERFGYDLTKMGFQGNFKTEHEPSIPGSGTEYITPVMSGIRSFKTAYLMGESLKYLGGHSIAHRGSQRNDPTGIHVNMGSVPNTHRKSAVKFMADYLRLTEDVYKKMTSPDSRYRYGTRSGWAYSSAAQANANLSHSGAPLRQFWSQDMTNMRIVPGTRETEYEYLRRTGEHWGTLSMHPTDGPGRLAKYKTIALHKLQLTGVLESRTAMYQPGGDVALAHLVMSSKLGADIYKGALADESLGYTDKLIPPTNGWGTRSKSSFSKILSDVFTITAPKDQKFVWDFYQKCKNG